MSGFAESRAKVSTRPYPSTQWSPVMQLSCSPAWLADARRSISRLTELRDGWDGGTSPMPQRTAIDAATRLLDEIERYSELPAPGVGPTIGGGLGIEWRHGSRDLDLEILPDGSIEYLKSERRASGFDVDDMEDGQITLDCPKEVRRLIGWLMQGV